METAGCNEEDHLAEMECEIKTNVNFTFLLIKTLNLNITCNMWHLNSICN